MWKPICNAPEDRVVYVQVPGRKPPVLRAKFIMAGLDEVYWLPEEELETNGPHDYIHPYYWWAGDEADVPSE